MLELVVLAGAVTAGFWLKGLSGMGEAIPLVALGVWVLPVTDLVVLVTVLDLVGSAAAMSASRKALVRRDDLPWAAALGVGTAGGLVVLAVAPARVVEAVFTVGLVVVALLMARTALGQARVTPTGPVRRLATATYAGFSGATTGVDGPPLAHALFGAEGLVDIRGRLMRLVLISATLRAVLLTATGIASASTVLLGLALVPVAVAAFVLSSRVHAHVRPRVVAGLCGALCLGSVATSLV